MKVRFYSSLSPVGPLRSGAARRLELIGDGGDLLGEDGDLLGDTAELLSEMMVATSLVMVVTSSRPPCQTPCWTPCPVDIVHLHNHA